jgi:hypothetical protein
VFLLLLVIPGNDSADRRLHRGNSLPGRKQ